MKKKLDTTGVLNELRGQSAFFPGRTQELSQPEQLSPVSQPDLPTSQQNEDHTTAPDTVIPRYHETMHDTMIPVSEEEILEAVRKAVKQIGKEPATQRLTLEEKQALADIEYSYKRQGVRTSGNEIIRVAINYLISEYRKNGERSILAQVIKRLNS